jgi:hypothetical protein
MKSKSFFFIESYQKMFYKLLLILIFVSQTLSQKEIFGLVGQGISETLKLPETAIRIETQFKSGIIYNFISQSLETLKVTITYG